MASPKRRAFAPFFAAALACCCAWASLLLVACMEEHVVMEKKSMEDQASSATGYAYSSDSDGPTSYMHFSDAEGDMEHIEVPWAQELLPPYEYNYVPILDTSMHYVPQLHMESDHGSYGGPSAYGEIDLNRIKYGFGEHGFDKEDEEHSSHAEKGEKGFQHLYDWDKEKKAEHDKEEHKGWFGAHGGKQEGHHKEEVKWGAKEAEGKANKGESFKEEKGKKKGVKTTGYHKVYQKDEFKKDHEFYDKADHKGHFDKYGEFDAHHEGKKGAYEKGGHHQSGYQADQQGKKGFYDKGQYENHDHGHKGELTEDEFHKNYEEFVKKGGEHDKQLHGYDDGSGGFKWKY